MKRIILLLALLLAMSAQGKNKDFKYKEYTIPSFIIAQAKANMQNDTLARQVYEAYLSASHLRATQYAKVRFCALAQKYAKIPLNNKSKNNNKN